MKELIDLMKELLMIKQEDDTVVGLTGFKRRPNRTHRKPVKKVQKEVKLSDLMRKKARRA